MAKKFYPDESDTFLTWRWCENYTGGRLFSVHKNTGKGTFTLNQRYYISYMSKSKQKKLDEEMKKLNAMVMITDKDGNAL